MINSCIAEFDDYPIHGERMIKQMDTFKGINPEFKATLYGIPALMKPEHWKPIESRPWLRVGIHGFRHRRGECRLRTTRYFKQWMDRIRGEPYDMICKPPFYGYGRRYVELMNRNRYAFACRNSNDIYRYFESPVCCRTIRMYCKYEQLHLRMFGHPNNSPFMFLPHTKKENTAVLHSAGRFMFSSEAARPMSMIYLGSGTHRIDGFDNLDKEAFGAEKWQWGDPLPYADNSVSFVLVQQSLMYADIGQYEDIFGEIARVLCTGGRVLVKEDNADNYIWKPVGRRGVMSHSTPYMVATAMQSAGLTINSTDSLQLVDKYASLCNRVDKVKKGWIYLLEGEKKGGRR